MWNDGEILEIVGTPNSKKEILLNLLIRETKGIKFSNVQNLYRDCRIYTI